MMYWGLVLIYSQSTINSILSSKKSPYFCVTEVAIWYVQWTDYVSRGLVFFISTLKYFIYYSICYGVVIVPFTSPRNFICMTKTSCFLPVILTTFPNFFLIISTIVELILSSMWEILLSPMNHLTVHWLPFFILFSTNLL